MIERFGHRAHRLLELAEIEHHILHGAFALEILLLKIGHHAPAMTVQVLAFAVVIRKKMGSVEAAFGFQTIHSCS